MFETATSEKGRKEGSEKRPCALSVTFFNFLLVFMMFVAQHGHLRRSIAGDNVFHVILLDVGGVDYIPHTLVPLKSLGLDPQEVKKLALKLHAHSMHYAHKLVQTRRSLEHSPRLQTDQERSAGLSARKLPDPH